MEMLTETDERKVIQTDAAVISNDEVIARHKVLVCHAPEIARMARPGHFVGAFASGTVNSILRKPFSIFQADLTAGTISLLYKIHGATTFGMSAKRPGDTLDIVGPLGGRVFRADPRADATHVMVGGGYGVPPLVFLAERIKQDNPGARVRFLVGARTRALLLCEAQIAGLGITPEMTTEDGSHGVKGRVTDVLKGIASANAAFCVYTCGPTPMMQAVSDICLAAKTPCQVSLEVPMPCGIGVCMGCVVDTAGAGRVRACTDGPVFEAADVVW
jgi:dihydroorotate dehydrogenase electron transfer subunit